MPGFWDLLQGTPPPQADPPAPDTPRASQDADAVPNDFDLLMKAAFSFDGEGDQGIQGMAYEDVVRRLDGGEALRFDQSFRTGSKQQQEEWRVRYVAEVDRMRERLRVSRRFLLDPRGVFIQYWDLATSIALIFTAFVTPFEVALGLETKLDALFAINQVVNLVFWVDMAVQFVLPILDDKAGDYIRDHKALALKYIKSWFFIDVVSVLPLDSVFLGNPEIFEGLPPNSPLIRGVKLLRVLHLGLLYFTLKPFSRPEPDARRTPGSRSSPSDRTCPKHHAHMS